MCSRAIVLRCRCDCRFCCCCCRLWYDTCSSTKPHLNYRDRDLSTLLIQYGLALLERIRFCLEYCWCYCWRREISLWTSTYWWNFIVAAAVVVVADADCVLVSSGGRRASVCLSSECVSLLAHWPDQFQIRNPRNRDFLEYWYCGCVSDYCVFILSIEMLSQHVPLLLTVPSL